MLSVFSTTNLSNASESSCSFCKWLLSFLTTQSTLSLATKKHGVEHHISTTSLPVYAHACRLESFKLAVVKAEFAYMGEVGIVQCSNSPWASPLHMVPKLDCSYGPCGDYRRLNDATIPVRYLVLHVQDFSARLACKTIFSKVDFPKTAAVTPFGLSSCESCLAWKMPLRLFRGSWTTHG